MIALPRLRPRPLFFIIVTCPLGSDSDSDSHYKSCIVTMTPGDSDSDSYSTTLVFGRALQLLVSVHLFSIDDCGYVYACCVASRLIGDAYPEKFGRLRRNILAITPASQFRTKYSWRLRLPLCLKCAEYGGFGSGSASLRLTMLNCVT